MKKLFLLSVLTLGLFVSCSKQDLDEPMAPEVQASKSLLANERAEPMEVWVIPQYLSMSVGETRHVYVSVWTGEYWVGMGAAHTINDPSGAYDIRLEGLPPYSNIELPDGFVVTKKKEGSATIQLRGSLSWQRNITIYLD